MTPPLPLRSMKEQGLPLISSTGPQTKLTKYLYLDCLRGFAAISVLVYHFVEIFEWVEFPRDGPLVWFRVGWMGVDLFFVMSGLVITLSAFRDIHCVDLDIPEQRVGFRRNFLARRVARILPLHYLTMFVHVTFVSPAIWRQDSLVQNLLAHLFFCHNLSPGFHGAINGSNWSVGVEFQFYLLVCFLAPMLKKARPLVIGLGGTLLAVMWRYYSFSYLNGKSSTTGVLVDSQVFFLTTQLPGLLDAFSLGVCLAKFLFKRDALVLDAITTVAVWIGTCVFTYILLHQYFSVQMYWHDVLMVTFWRSGLALSCASFLLLATTATVSKHAQKALSCLKYLGDISYGIYLWHLPVLVSLKEANWESKRSAFCLVICLTLVCASASWHFVEQPLAKVVYALLAAKNHK